MNAFWTRELAERRYTVRDFGERRCLVVAVEFLVAWTNFIDAVVAMAVASSDVNSFGGSGSYVSGTPYISLMSLSMLEVMEWNGMETNRMYLVSRCI